MTTPAIEDFEFIRARIEEIRRENEPGSAPPAPVPPPAPATGNADYVGAGG